MPSQKITRGCVMLIMCTVSFTPNETSIALIGHPKNHEANKIGATSCEFLAIYPKIWPFS